MSPEQQPGTERRAPRRAWLRFAILVVILASGFFIVRWTPVGNYFDLDQAVAKLESWGEHPQAPGLMILIWTLIAPLGMPVSPLVFASAVVFGTFWGWVYSMVGSMAGASLTFFVARRLGHDMVAHWLGETRLRRVENLVARHAFSTIFRLRFVPLPFVLLNTGAALAGVRFSTFFFASLLGLAPSLLIFSYFCHTLVGAAAADRPGMLRNLILALLAFLALSFLPRLLSRADPESEEAAPEEPAS